MTPNDPPPFPLADGPFGKLAGRLRPDLIANEAADFLAFGAKEFTGFDPHDPEIRRTLIDLDPAAFESFRLRVPPELLPSAVLPADWERDPKHHAAAYARAAEIEQWAKLPPHLCVIISPEREALAWKRSDL
jgi:hypothetical protein